MKTKPGQVFRVYSKVYRFKGNCLPLKASCEVKHAQAQASRGFGLRTWIFFNGLKRLGRRFRLASCCFQADSTLEPMKRFVVLTWLFSKLFGMNMGDGTNNMLLPWSFLGVRQKAGALDRLPQPMSVPSINLSPEL